FYAVDTTSILVFPGFADQARGFRSGEAFQLTGHVRHEPRHGLYGLVRGAFRGTAAAMARMFRMRLQHRKQRATSAYRDVWCRSWPLESPGRARPLSGWARWLCTACGQARTR